MRPRARCVQNVLSITKHFPAGDNTAQTQKPKCRTLFGALDEKVCCLVYVGRRRVAAPLGDGDDALRGAHLAVDPQLPRGDVEELRMTRGYPGLVPGVQA